MQIVTLKMLVLDEMDARQLAAQCRRSVEDQHDMMQSIGTYALQTGFKIFDSKTEITDAL